VGAYFSLRHLRVERRLTFRETQLAAFYAPLAGLRKQILAKSELRVRISNAANAAWQERVQSNPRPMLRHEEEFAPYKRSIEYDNTQLRDELIPMYRQMLKLFTEKYHLAAPETRAFYQEFLDFVEIWNRWLAEALPVDVWEKLELSILLVFQCSIFVVYTSAPWRAFAEWFVGQSIP
jgi:hypothetical protein